MNKTKSILMLAIFIALAFTFSCFSPDDDNGGDLSSSSGSSDSGAAPSPCPNAVTSDDSVSCGGQTYKTVQIGDQVWMAKNLNYNVRGSKCYGNAESNCNKYGRLYGWETAKKVCPAGWHLPSNDDWLELVSYVDSINVCGCAGKLLKAKNGWSSDSNGTDKYGFSALPGGYGHSYSGIDSYNNVGDFGNWWTVSEYDSLNAYYRYMHYTGEYVSEGRTGKDLLQSVRCVQD